ncbi:MAG: FliG C-terminal domain-containing protein [Elusimicrobiota bacterium]
MTSLLLACCLLPWQAWAELQPPNLDLLKMRDEVKREAQSRIQTEILDRVLGQNKASVFVDLELSLRARRRENLKGGAGKTEEYKAKGEKQGAIPTDMFLPGVPRPKTVTPKKEMEIPEAAQGRTAELSKVEQEEIHTQEVQIKDFKATVIHDKGLSPKKRDEVRALILDAMSEYEMVPENVIFREAEYYSAGEKPWKQKLLDDLKEPKVFIPLLYALLTLLLLLFLFGPLRSFFRRYTEALAAKPAAEVNIESNITPPDDEEEGGAGGGGGGGTEDGKLDIMIGRKPPEPPPDPESEEEDDMAKMEPFAYITEENLKRLANLFLLRREEPWLIAVVLSYLQPEFAREVLASLPVEIQSKVAMEALKVRQVTREQVRAIDEDIKENVEFVVGGIERLTRMLEESDPATRMNILESLKNEKPVVYEHVRRSILLFEDVVEFPDKEMQIIVRELKTEDMAKALQNCTPEVVDKFFKNMSANAASLLKESMEFMKDLTPTQIEDERGKILDTVKTLEKEGKVNIRSGGDLGSYQEVLATDDERGKKYEAVEKEEPKVELNPEEAKKYFDAGVSSYEEGKQDEALEYFRQAVDYDPDLWEAAQYMGTILSEMGRTSEALMYYEKVLEKHPDQELQAWVDAQKTQAQS